MPEQADSAKADPDAAKRYQDAEERVGESGNVKPAAADAGLDTSRGPDPDKAGRPGGAPSAPSLPAGSSAGES